MSSKKKTCTTCGRRMRPEDFEFIKLKDTVVRVYPLGVTDKARAVYGMLRWIDVYTIGLAKNWVRHPDTISIIYKHGIQIEPLDPTEATLLDISQGEAP